MYVDCTRIIAGSYKEQSTLQSHFITSIGASRFFVKRHNDDVS